MTDTTAPPHNTLTCDPECDPEYGYGSEAPEATETTCPAVTRIQTGAIEGIEGVPVTVEVDITTGIPALNIVGLPDTTVSEAKERIKSAIKNAGFEFPLRKVIVNLAPAEVKKIGAAYDLPMAVAILKQSEFLLESHLLKEALFIGELSLDGTLRPVKGVLLNQQWKTGAQEGRIDQ